MQYFASQINSTNSSFFLLLPFVPIMLQICCTPGCFKGVRFHLAWFCKMSTQTLGDNVQLFFWGVWTKNSNFGPYYSRFFNHFFEEKYFGPNYSRFFNHFFTAKYFGPNYSRFFNHFFEANIFGPNYSRFFNHFYQPKHFGPNYSRFFNHFLHIF